MNIFFVLLFFILKANAVVIFNPDSQTEFNKYYETPRYPAVLHTYQSTVPFEHMKNNNNKAIWAPSIIVDLYQIINFEKLQKKVMIGESPFLSNLKNLNDQMFCALNNHQSDWSSLFDLLFDQIEQSYKDLNNGYYRKLLAGKNLLRYALEKEIENYSQGKSTFWRFTTNFENDKKTEVNTSFGYSLLAGYVLDGYRYDFTCGFSSLSACTFSYCANSLEAKQHQVDVSKHVLYFVTVDQEYLNKNTSFYGKIDHYPQKNHPTFGYYPPIVQVSEGCGEFFHPRLNPSTFLENMIEPVDYQQLCIK